MAPGDESDAELARRLAHVDLIRRRMINVVGHELKTPVSAIRGLADAMATAGEDELRSELAPAVARNAARLEALIDDLLVAAGILTVLPVGEPQGEAVKRALDEAWAAVGANSGLEAEGDLEASVLVRPGTLSKLLARLLDNAVKYGGPPVRAGVRAGDGRVAIEVRSSGALTDGDLELAFEPFFRGEAAVTAAPGFGIGLPVARALAEHDGGTVTLVRDGNVIVARVELQAS
jgi:two-component system sensor histidine kinase KdpD